MTYIKKMPSKILKYLEILNIFEIKTLEETLEIYKLKKSKLYEICRKFDRIELWNNKTSKQKTKELVNEILKLKEIGLTNKEIAAKLNKTVYSITHYNSKFKIKPNTKSNKIKEAKELLSRADLNNYIPMASFTQSELMFLRRHLNFSINKHNTNLIINSFNETNSMQKTTRNLKCPVGVVFSCLKTNKIISPTKRLSKEETILRNKKVLNMIEEGIDKNIIIKKFNIKIHYLYLIISRSKQKLVW